MKEAFDVLAKQVSDLQRLQQQRFDDAVVDKHIEINSKIFDQAATYNNIVITLGYAAFFAIWNVISDEINPWDNALIATFMGISVLIFAIWTVFSSNWMTFKIAGTLNLLSDQSLTSAEKVDGINKRQIELTKQQRNFRITWMVVFAASVTTAIVGGLLILSLAFLTVVGIDFSYEELLGNNP